MTALVEAVVPVGPLALRDGTLRLMLMFIFQILPLGQLQLMDIHEATFQSSFEFEYGPIRTTPRLALGNPADAEAPA